MNDSSSLPQFGDLEDLYSYEILDSEEEKQFDDLVNLASFICDCPISTITFIDKDRQWFKAKKNMPDRETSLDLSFCAHAVEQDNILIIEDASKDERFSSFANVTGGLKIRFYAGSPVRSSKGNSIGTICVIDTKPRKLSNEQIEALNTLGAHITYLLELRLLNKRLGKRSDSLIKSTESHEDFFANAPMPQWIVETVNYKFLAVNNSAQIVYGYNKEEFSKITLLDIATERPHVIKENIQMASKSGKINFITTHRKKNGDKILVDVTVNTIIYRGKKVLIVTVIDLSEKLGLIQELKVEKSSTNKKIERATILAQQQERDYIGKELHDNINQMLASVKLYLDIAQSDDKMRLDLIAQGKKYLIDTISEVRNLSHKLASSIHPGLDIGEAMDEILAPYYLNHSFVIDYSLKGNLISLPIDHKMAILRIVQESIQNIDKYSEAKNVSINLSVGDEVELTIRDDGKGFDMAVQSSGIGLKNIKERVTKLMGKVTIISSPGNGTNVSVTIPMISETGDKRTFTNSLIQNK